jgi:hypothetical protein
MEQNKAASKSVSVIPQVDFSVKKN